MAKERPLSLKLVSLGTSNPYKLRGSNLERKKIVCHTSCTDRLVDRSGSQAGIP